MEVHVANVVEFVFVTAVNARNEILTRERGQAKMSRRCCFVPTVRVIAFFWVYFLVN